MNGTMTGYQKSGDRYGATISGLLYDDNVAWDHGNKICECP